MLRSLQLSGMFNQCSFLSSFLRSRKLIVGGVMLFRSNEWGYGLRQKGISLARSNSIDLGWRTQRRY